MLLLAFGFYCCLRCIIQKVQAEPNEPKKTAAHDDRDILIIHVIIFLRDALTGEHFLDSVLYKILQFSVDLIGSGAYGVSAYFCRAAIRN